MYLGLAAANISGSSINTQVFDYCWRRRYAEEVEVAVLVDTRLLH